MTADINPVWRAELAAALGVLDPQLRGFHKALADPVSPGLKQALTDEIANREQRRAAVERMLAVLDQAASAMAALEADGYPAAVRSTLTDELRDELQLQIDDLEVIKDL